MRQFKPKEASELSKSGGRSKFSKRTQAERDKFYGEKQRLINANEELRERQKNIPKGKWFE
jgi:allantoicase